MTAPGLSKVQRAGNIVGDVVYIALNAAVTWGISTAVAEIPYVGVFIAPFAGMGIAIILDKLWYGDWWKPNGKSIDKWVKEFFTWMFGGKMRLKRDYSHLPIDEQIKKLKRNIKFYFIFSFVWSAFVITLSVIIIVFTQEWEIGVGFLCTIPVSIFFGGIMQTKHDKEKIKELEEQRTESELQEKV